jgi:mannose-6-phosphate isomerase-like protein (cupin superfamily)
MSEVIKTTGESTPVADSVQKFRRIVTGHDSTGKAVFVDDAPCAHAHSIMGIPTFATTELWKTSQSPVDNSGDAGDPAAGSFDLRPPKSGSILRIVEFAPDSTWSNKDGSSAPMMHRTASLDYAYVIKGQIYAVLDNEERLLKEGDVLIQRGTNHAWANRTDEPCLVLCVLIDASPLVDNPPH